MLNVNVPVSRSFQDTVEAMKLVPQERVQQQTYVHNVDVPVHRVFQDTVDATTILESQLHKVNGRNASSDLTMRPLSSTVEDLGMNTVLLAAECVGTAPPSSTKMLKVWGIYQIEFPISAVFAVQPWTHMEYPLAQGN